MASFWDDEADVVVVGYGGAGASAAIAAHDAGASVLIVEKSHGGGNTKLATRTFISPENSRAAQQHILALSRAMLDEEIVNSSLQWMSQNMSLFVGLVAKLRSVRRAPLSPPSRAPRR